jgi:c-di-AMP phosphodiesterase-like protein
MFPANGEYVVVGALFLVYLILRLNLFPVAISRRTSRTYLLALLCGVALLNLRVHQYTIRQGFQFDFVTASEKSFQALNEAVPNVRRVGFITDVKRTSRAHWLARYLRTQYALAPRVVESGTSPEWVVVNADKFDSKLIPDGLVLIRDFGDGLLLFRKRVE